MCKDRKQLEREIFGGYTVGDTVFMVQKVWEKDKCPVCLGDRKVIAEFRGEEIEVDCPKCAGTGGQTSTHLEAAECEIKGLYGERWIDEDVSESGKNTSFVVAPKGTNKTTTLQLHAMFRTKEDANGYIEVSKGAK